MVYTFTECLERFGDKYNISKLVTEGRLYKQEKGIYSDEKYVPVLQIISKKYPKAVFTMNSAFYYHNLTDVIPDCYYLMTSRGTSKIADKRVIQIFENSNHLMLGTEYLQYNSIKILVYSRERMLIELLRNKNKLPFDYYKEIIGNYRRILEDLDIQAIQDYANAVPKSGMIMETLRLEVF
ncbi:MAG: hypothetical protein IJ091_05915 [Oscillospiraceae bacterium]|nr:hypothetical protein [Oscillospiraceae bacterium]